ncbi:PGN_0703 family putative restriction endonuclease [Alicyclobacillus fodiniaquatilis]|uniref:PD-(D/E)XK nuclease superfamily protein n=1 Tax=Alicyclobacillus fodiniaquatilis TaxID=1661150 RepID=A0ABW4JK17_9BACL
MCKQSSTGYRDKARRRQTDFKRGYSGLSGEARNDGFFNGKQYSFVLPERCASENLYEGIRDDVLRYFREFRIKFWGGKDRTPSNHMCSSQVACLNLLFPSALDKDFARDVVGQLDSEVETVIPLENGQYIAFEWRDENNLLKEPGFNPNRLRGQLSTSVDAAIYYSTTAGKRNLLLIEWKYTESKSTKDERISSRETDKRSIYERFFFHDDSPFIDEVTCMPGSEDAAFYDSFFLGEGYQLLRLQLLANAIQKRGEFSGMPVDHVTMVFATPKCNSQVRSLPFSDGSSPRKALARWGSSWDVVWPQLLRDPCTFMSVSWNEILGNVRMEKHPKWRHWADYVADRYGVDFCPQL